MDMLVANASAWVTEAAHTPSPTLTAAWSWMLRHCSEFSLYTWLFYVIIVSAYFFGGGLFFIIDYYDLAPQYKLQPKARFSAHPQKPNSG